MFTSQRKATRLEPNFIQLPFINLRVLTPLLPKYLRIPGVILGRLGHSWASSPNPLETHGAAVAPQRPPAIKMLIFYRFLKQKKNTLKIYSVLKAFNGKTPAGSKKKSQKRQTTTTGRFWASAFFSCRKQNYVKLCTALEGERLATVGGC